MPLVPTSSKKGSNALKKYEATPKFQSDHKTTPEVTIFQYLFPHLLLLPVPRDKACITTYLRGGGMSFHVYEKQFGNECSLYLVNKAVACSINTYY